MPSTDLELLPSVLVGSLRRNEALLLAQFKKMDTTESTSLSRVNESVLHFTSDLTKKFATSGDENYICSSLSAHIALSMAAYGADNNTAVEMKKVLYISNDDSEQLVDYQKLADILNTKENIMGGDQNARDNVMLFEHEYIEEKKKLPDIVTLANKLYISKDIKIKEDYENLLNTYFRSKSELIDFSNPLESAEIVNKWCNEATNGKINEIILPEDITPGAALILTNAVYFKGYWLHEFNSAIPKTYYLSKSDKIEVPTMDLEEELYYRNLRELNAKAVRLDFMRGKQYMEIIVPNEIDGLKVIQENLDKIDKGEFVRGRVHLWLPKFEFETKIDFNKHLKELGMVDAFDAGLANFNKICNTGLFIQKVLQKAYIKVDELGCEAAAVTAVLCVEMCLQITSTDITIEVDRPFLFRIMDEQLKIPLFVGSVVDPR